MVSRIHAPQLLLHKFPYLNTSSTAFVFVCYLMERERCPSWFDLNFPIINMLNAFYVYWIFVVHPLRSVCLFHLHEFGYLLNVYLWFSYNAPWSHLLHISPISTILPMCLPKINKIKLKLYKLSPICVPHTLTHWTMVKLPMASCLKKTESFPIPHKK